MDGPAGKDTGLFPSGRPSSSRVFEVTHTRRRPSEKYGTGIQPSAQDHVEFGTYFRAHTASAAVSTAPHHIHAKTSEAWGGARGRGGGGGQTAAAADDPSANDGADVVALLSDCPDWTEEEWCSPMNDTLPQEGSRALGESIPGRDSVLDFDPEFFAHPERALEILGIADLIEARHLWSAQWRPVSEAYTRAVWSDLECLLLLQDEDHDRAHLKMKDGAAAPLDGRSLERLRLLLAHFRGARDRGQLETRDFD